MTYFPGIPIRTTMDNATTTQYSSLLHQLTLKAKSAVRDLEPNNELTFFRIRSKKNEIMIAPGKQKPCDCFYFIMFERIGTKSALLGLQCSEEQTLNLLFTWSFFYYFLKSLLFDFTSLRHLWLSRSRAYIEKQVWSVTVSSCTLFGLSRKCHWQGVMFSGFSKWLKL